MAGACRTCAGPVIGPKQQRYCDVCLPLRQEARRLEQRHNPEQAREYARQYKLEHPEWNREHRRLYYQRHPDRVKQRSHQDVNNRRARLADAPGTVTLEQFWEKCESQGWVCQYCGTALTRKTATIDHVIPLGVAGSTNYLSNIVPCCRPCNARKGRRLHDGSRRTDAA